MTNEQWNQREIAVDEKKLKSGKPFKPVVGYYVITAHEKKPSLFKRIVDKVKGWVQK